MKIGSMFSGYGGLDLAVEAVFNAETIWQAEWEDAPSKVLAARWPNVHNYRDVTAVDWPNIPPVDIITGGFPCQDVSLAGRRAGMTEGTRSNLWGAMRTAIETIQPRYVVAENVRGLLSAKAYSDSDMEPGQGPVGDDGPPNLRAIGRVLADLSDIGYDAQWCGLRAADVGAPHGRFRVFILAERRDAEPANANHAGLERQRDPHGAASTERHGHAGQGVDRSAAHTDDQRGDRRREWPIQDGRGQPADCGDITSHPERLERERRGIAGVMGSAASSRETDSQQRERVRETASNSGTGARTDWGPYAPAIRRWEQLRGPAPAPTELTAKGNHRLSALFCEWMMGLPPGWVTDIDISRNEQLKALGNGVVWQQAAAALDHMLALDAV